MKLYESIELKTNPINKLNIKQFQKNNFYKIIDVQTEEAINPLKAYIVIETPKLTETIDISEKDIVDGVKSIMLLNNIVNRLNEEILLAMAKEIKKRLFPKNKPFRVLIAQGRQPVNGKDSELKFYFNRYQPAGSISEDGKIDYRKKNFLAPVEKGDILVEFVKPTKGENGYDVFGNIIYAENGLEKEGLNTVRFDFSNIEKIDEGNVIKLIAKTEGVIIYQNNGTYGINTSVSVKTVDIKTTGNVESNTDIEVKIGKEISDYIEDTIAAGMKVKAKKVVVSGNVGPHAVVEGEEVDIQGSVHQDAKIIAKKVVISICRGTVEADDVEVDLAEHANIISKNSIVINKSVACKLCSPRIEIKDIMVSSNITTSSESIVINNVVGNNNIIAIKSLSLPWIKEEYEKLHAEMSLIAAETITLKEDYERRCSVVEKENTKYRKIREKISEIKKDRNKIPEAFLLALNKFRNYCSVLQKKEQEYIKMQENLKNVHDKISDLKNSYKKGHVMIKGKISNGNKIVFGDKLSKVIETATSNVKIYVREIQGEEEIVIEPAQSTKVDSPESNSEQTTP